MNECKIIFIGQSGVGKTLLVQQCVGLGLDTQATIGVAFYRKQVRVANRDITLNIWDTSGQERYNSLSKIYVRNAKCAILVFDINDKDTFEELTMWKRICDEGGVANYIVVGNKIDLASPEALKISEAQTKEWCNRNNISKYLFTSALHNINVNELLQEISAIAGLYVDDFVAATFPDVAINNTNKCGC